MLIRVLGDADDWDVLVERVEEVSAEAGVVFIVQPNVAVDDDASWWRWELGENGFDARQLPAEELAGLIVADLMDGDRALTLGFDRSRY